MSGHLGLIGGIVLVVLIVGGLILGRWREYRRVRFGVFIERERFDDREDLDA